MTTVCHVVFLSSFFFSKNGVEQIGGGGGGGGCVVVTFELIKNDSSLDTLFKVSVTRIVFIRS